MTSDDWEKRVDAIAVAFPSPQSDPWVHSSDALALVREAFEAGKRAGRSEARTEDANIALKLETEAYESMAKHKEWTDAWIRYRERGDALEDLRYSIKSLAKEPGDADKP